VFTLLIYSFVDPRSRTIKENNAKTNIPRGTSCVPLLPDLFLYSYEASFIHELLKKNENKLVPFFNFTFGYIDDDAWCLC